jgi:hypothetical protein
MDEWPWCSQAQGKEGLKINIYQKQKGLSMGQARVVTRVVDHFLVGSKLIITLQIIFCAIYSISPFSM